MQRDEALKRLRLLKPKFPEMNIRRLALFGSTARDEAAPESDVDLLIEFDNPVGFFGFFKTQGELERYLETHVDLVAFDAIKKNHHLHILNEAVDV